MKDIINADPYCPVELRPVVLNEKKAPLHAVYLQNPEGQWEAIGTASTMHGTGYQLVPNSLLRSTMEHIIGQSPVKFEPLFPVRRHNEDGSEVVSEAATVSWNGRQMAAHYISEPLGEWNGHGVRLGLRGINSYDRSSAAGIEFFFAYMRCLNQFYASHLLGSFTFPHRGSEWEQNIIKAMPVIMNRVEQFPRVITEFRNLQECSLSKAGKTRDDMTGFLTIHNQLLADGAWKPSLDGELLAELAGQGVTHRLGLPQEANDGSLWWLLNGFTSVTTHTMSGLNGADRARAVTEKVLVLAKAA